MTLTSASVKRANIDIIIDLPTPEPAKMPIRWPRQIDKKVLMERTPTSILGPTRLRKWAFGACARRA